MTIQLHSWLATRAALKNECKGQALAAKHVSSPSLVPAEGETEAVLTTGLVYWYYDGDKIKGAVYGNKSLHTSRRKAGNVYRTREDAQHKRNAVPVA